MTLPAITTPAGTPKFLASSHTVTEDSAYAVVKSATGHSRQRRVWTVTERLVNVEWFLEEDLLIATEDWYENTLQAGTRTFSVQLRNEGATPDLLWWEVRWISFQTEMMNYGRGRVSGQLMLFGEGSSTPPEFGVLAMEVSLPLDAVPGSVIVPVAYGMEVFLPLIGGEVHFGVEYDLPLESQDDFVPPASQTWNPADTSAYLALSNGNLTLTRLTGGPSDYVMSRALEPGLDGSNRYWELDLVTLPNRYVIAGVAALSDTADYVGHGAGGWGYAVIEGALYHNGAQPWAPGSLPTAVQGDVLMFALANDGKFYVGKNGAWFNSGDPAAGTGSLATVTGTPYPACSIYLPDGYVVTAHFASADFVHTPPSGFVPFP